MLQVILVGFLSTANGCSCECHPFRCVNALVLEHKSHSIRLQIQLRLVDESHLTGYQVQVNGSDSCCVCFAAWECAVGVGGQCLNVASM